MMALLMKRAEELCRRAQRQQVERLAEQLRDLLGTSSIEAADARILVSGRRLGRRWLSDPRLRFLGKGLK